MARIRTIKPKFWDDSKLAKVSRDARLTFIGMWNFCDDLGVLIADSIWLKSKIFPYDQIQLHQFEKWLTELHESGFISLFSSSEEKFYYLPNFNKHQLINKPNFVDVHIQKDVLHEIVSKSRIDHGLITDESRGDRIVKDSKVGSTDARDISDSNLYRQAKIPTLDEVTYSFLDKGGTKEMAERFFELNSATEWFYKNSPIRNFRTLVPSFIQHWNRNERKEPAELNGITEQQMKMRQAL